MSSPEGIAVVGGPVVAELPRRASLRLRCAHWLSRATLRRFFDLAVWIDEHGLLTPGQSMFVARWLETVVAPLRPARGTRLRRIAFENFRAEWVWDDASGLPGEGDEPAAILYFHGGGFVSCGLNTHRRMVARIARVAGSPLLQVDYRQIPQAHITETIDDCVAAYGYLLDLGIPAERIIVMGDSAGGGLAFAMALAARTRSLPMPAGIVAISPWADYDSTHRRAHPNDQLDALLGADAYALPVKWGIMRGGRLDPMWSPVNHDFTGLPPVLIQVGSTEVLVADVELLAARCAAAAVPVQVQIWDSAFHVFQVAADVLPDARQAIGDIGAFVRAVLDTAGAHRREVRAEKALA
ncbi:alpha/beta hydrolase [Nocardia cyriacigeorgica]|uniref:Alpha/beta hydrolase n=1 Tax=Nocardia cyriacigeorgica TaxID=135487 RepID=A0A5R8P816_9NOCA|nr:alpha/beta hydrolase [Nocardia cyriacigeorgica]TLG00350.1 alpha/beta hydrolase [Nocardia cyriacigeorgica]